MNFCLTDEGKEYMARVNAGELQLHLTKAVTGSGQSSSPEILTYVLDEKQQIQIDAVRAEGEYTYISCVLTNLELDDGYILKQIGIYAIDDTGKEVLLIIGQDNYGDRIPEFSEKEVEYQYNIGMRVSNAAQITFDFSINDFLRKKYFYEHLNEFEKYKDDIQTQFKELPIIKIGEEHELNRKDMILFEILKDTNKVIRILERDRKDAPGEYVFASVFDIAKQREELQSKDALSVLFGKIKRYFADLKPNVYKEADNPLVLMTETTYKPPVLRTEGSLFGLITKERGLTIIFFNRYVQGVENPTIKSTLYGIKMMDKTDAERAESPYKAILNNIVYIKEGESNNRQRYMLYAVTKRTR